MQDHNAPELLRSWSGELEMQVNCVATGEPVEGKRNTWHDEEFTWHHIRIPRNADSVPEFRDYQLGFPLEKYALAIGSTGWNWKERKSEYVGFDFDAIVGHGPGIGLTPERLEEIRAAAEALSYNELRRSTGGAGLHLYVRFASGIATANHTEHAALGRAVLGLISKDAGFDFAASVDACGGNMWLWHRKMTRENGGLGLLKAASKKLSEADLPANWRDHVEVVSGKRAKVRVPGVDAKCADEFDVITSAFSRVPLDDEHRRHIEWLAQSGISTIWVPDYHCLHTHTVALERLHASQKLKGVFSTISTGSDLATANCFCFPLKDGAWKVVRFGTPNEHATWSQGTSVSTRLNCVPDLPTAAKAFGGAEDTDRPGEFLLATGEAIKAAAALGEQVTLPARLCDRPARLRVAKDGRLIFSFARLEGDNDVSGWAAKGKNWSRFLARLRPKMFPPSKTNWFALL